MLLWNDDPAGARARLPATVDVVRDDMGFWLVGTAYMLDWVVARGHVRPRLGPSQDFGSTV
ncbi:hypothetical protein LZC95_19915 [Pendulispora brunnea]|uniref:Uncharacterized protein n=1 Tax=Pendulispora brunnea TaxID=2905690 RepID=A0ABZ2KK68_9BACT